MKKDKFVTIILSLLVIIMVGVVILKNLGIELPGASNSQSNEMPGGMPNGIPGGMPDASDKAGKTSSQKVANVEAKIMNKSTFIRTINVNGEISIKDSSRQVPANTTGEVKEILVSRGDYVEAGTVIAKADPSTPGSKYKIKDIKSTVSGKVLSVDTYVGQNVSSNTVVATVGNPDNLILSVSIPEKYLSSVEIGSEATFTTAAWPEKTYNAVVNYIAPSVDSSTRTVDVEMKISNADEKLMSGMFVKTKLIVEKQDAVLTVPTESLGTYLSNAVLYVINQDNTVTRTVVTTGSYNDIETVITSGIKEGDKVVTLGSVTDGTKVNVIN